MRIKLSEHNQCTSLVTVPVAFNKKITFCKMLHRFSHQYFKITGDPVHKIITVFNILFSSLSTNDIFYILLLVSSVCVDIKVSNCACVIRHIYIQMYPYF